MPRTSAARRTADADDARSWTGSTPLLDLDDTKLRLRAQALTQLCRSEREKALAVYAFVKRIPLARPFKMRLHTAREVLQQEEADTADKATLLVALLRLAGIPARLHYLTLRPAVMRGLMNGPQEPTRPVLEAWLDGRWVATDTYIFDGPYASAARHRLLEDGWERGYGIHAAGQLLWDGATDAWAGSLPPARDQMVLHDHGHFCDPLEFVSSPTYRATHARLARAMQWNMLAPGLDRAIRRLRVQGTALQGVAAAGGRR